MILSNFLVNILAAPVAVPVEMAMGLLEAIRDEADKELYPNESQIKERLVELQTLLESGQITEREYEAKEEKLIEQWREIQKGKEA